MTFEPEGPGIRRRLTVALVSILPRCPCCLQAQSQDRTGKVTQ